MKNIFYTVLMLSVLIGSLGCYDYETQFEGPYSQDSEFIEPELPRELVYISGGNVYLANQFVTDSIIIDNSGEVARASINYEHSNVLFKRTGENIQIYNIEEERVTGEVAGSIDATWFDYHANNETIYYLIGDNLHTQGPELLSENPKDLRDFFAFNIDIIGAVITNVGDIIYTLKVLGGNTTYIIRTNHLNESQNIYERVIPNAVRFMRINSNDSAILGTSQPGSDMVEIRPNNGGYDWFNDFRLGVPGENNNRGYYVTNNLLGIETPSGEEIEVTTGLITSIDF